MSTNLYEKDPLELVMEKAWQEQEAQYQLLLRLEQESALSIWGREKLISAFAKWPKTVVCIDERVSLGNADEPEISIAGTLVLMNGRQFEVTIEKLKRLGVDRVTYHEGCGACSLFLSAHPRDRRSALQVAKDAATAVHQSLGLSREPELVGFSRQADHSMTGHPEFHHARTIIIDGSGRFNGAILGIKDVFQSSIYYHPDQNYSLIEIGVMQQIAFGHHGFGHKFTSQNPLLVILVGKDQSHNSGYLANQLADAFREYQDRIKLLMLDPLS